MIKRRLHDIIALSLKSYPVVGLLGPRQVGKTTLAKVLQKNSAKRAIYIDLELPSDLNRLHDPELYLGQFQDSLVIIDEIQRMPSLFPLIRALIDKKRTPGRFLVLGSASPELIRHSSESLAGRISYHELSPLGLSEIGYKSAAALWLRGGYPLSLLADDDDKSYSWRESFIKTYLEMDIPQLGIRIPSVQLRRFWTMLAHINGGIWNASQLAGSLGLSAPTVRGYLDILEETFVARSIQPYHFNIKKRLVKSPKIYVRDSGLLHALLRIRTNEDLHGSPYLGNSWEGMVIEQIIQLLPEGWSFHYYRTAAGAEIDLLLLDRKNKPVAVEIKYSASPKPEKGFWNALEDLSCKKGFVVYPGGDSYPISRYVQTLPFKEIGMIFS